MKNEYLHKLLKAQLSRYPLLNSSSNCFSPQNAYEQWLENGALSYCVTSPAICFSFCCQMQGYCCHMKQAQHFSIPREGVLLEEMKKISLCLQKVFCFFFFNKLLTSYPILWTQEIYLFYCLYNSFNFSSLRKSINRRGDNLISWGKWTGHNKRKPSTDET